jgi:hypothetical protein
LITQTIRYLLNTALPSNTDEASIAEIGTYCLYVTITHPNPNIMIYLIYKTDIHHSYDSRELMGIAIDRNPVYMIGEQVQKEGKKLSEDDVYNLTHIRQTQGYSGEGEFQYEEFETDILL